MTSIKLRSQWRACPGTTTATPKPRGLAMQWMTPSAVEKTNKSITGQRADAVHRPAICERCRTVKDGMPAD